MRILRLGIMVPACTQLALLGSLVCVSGAQAGTEKAIFGADSRKEYYQITDKKLRAAADATAALVQATDLSGNFLAGTPLTKAYNICKSERFSDEPVGAFCSGSLIAPGLLLTAGHCIQTQAECDATKITFGFRKHSAADSGQNIDPSLTYKCKRIVSRHLDDNGADYGVIELDRAVTDRQPLAIDLTGVNVGDKLYVMGHPTGLPFKIADGTIDGNAHRDYFEANLDVFAGNSGSPVINAKTLKLEGVLVRGLPDYGPSPDINKNCDVPEVYPDDFIVTEESTRITSVEGLFPIAPAVTNLRDLGTNEDSAKLGWTSGAGSTTHFVVRADRGRVAPGTCEGGRSVNTASISLTGLLPDHPYVISVCAANAENTLSDPVSLKIHTTAVQPAPAVGALAARALSANAVALSWKSGGGSTRGFVIATQRGGSESTVSCTSAGAVKVGAVGSFNAQGLLAERNYIFAVCAFNASGALSPVVKVRASTPAVSAPVSGIAAPSALTAKVIDAHTVSLQWASGSSKTRAFLIVAQKGGSASTIDCSKGSDVGLSRSTTLGKLLAAHNYIFGVCAVGAKGVISQPVIVRATTP